LILEHIRPAEVETEASVEIEKCEGVSLTGCQVIEARLRGIDVREFARARGGLHGARRAGLRAAVRVDGKSKSVMVVNNFLAKGSDGDCSCRRRPDRRAGNQMIGR
jgi:hypothetical protein